jgi:hypothetical protein
MTPRTRPTLAAVLAAVVLAAVTGCGPTHTTTTDTGTRTAAASGTSTAPTAGAATGASTIPAAPGGGGVLVAEDPDHGTAQPFPARGTCHARTVPHGVLPDPACTPGATDPHVTQATLATTICRAGGYTSTVRPPESVTSVEKKTAIAAYAAPGPTSSYELDHLVSLELGGSPNSPRNLWPQPSPSPNPKDKLESALHDLVCSNRMTLTDAQNAIATDWITTYRQVLGHDPS